MTLPDGWLIKPLAEVAQIVMGQSPDSKYYSEEEVGLPFLQGCAEFQGRHPKHIIYCSHSKKIGCAGSILLSVRAPVGRMNVANRDYVIGRGLAALKGTQATQEFLEHFLVFLEPRFKLASQGSTFEAINSSELKQWPILHPKDKTEQAKIAEVLSTMDRAIEQTEILIAKQQRIKTGLMQDLLTRGIDEHGNPRSQKTHKFKNSPLGQIPVEWTCDRLGLHLTTIEQGWSPDCDGDPAPVGYWGVLKTTAVTWDGYQDFENKLLPSGLEPRPRLEVQPKDVLMTRGGPNSRVGVATYVRTTQQKLMLSDKLYRLKYKRSVHPEFLAMALASSWTQRHLSTLKTGLAESQTNISQAIVKNLLIRVPLPGEQEQIASVVRGIDKQLIQLRCCLKKLRAVKAGLMRDLLTGDRRVSALLRSSKG